MYIMYKLEIRKESSEIVVQRKSCDGFYLLQFFPIGQHQEVRMRTFKASTCTLLEFEVSQMCMLTHTTTY